MGKYLRDLPKDFKVPIYYEVKQITPNVYLNTYQFKDIKMFVEKYIMTNEYGEKWFEKINRSIDRNFCNYDYQTESIKEDSSSYEFLSFKQYWENVSFGKNSKLEISKNRRKTIQRKNFVGSIPNIEHCIQNKPKSMIEIKTKANKNKINVLVSANCATQAKKYKEEAKKFLNEQDNIKEINFFACVGNDYDGEIFFTINKIDCNLKEIDNFYSLITSIDLMRRFYFLLYELDFKSNMKYNSYGRAIFPNDLEKVLQSIDVSAKWYVFSNGRKVKSLEEHLKEED